MSVELDWKALFVDTTFTDTLLNAINRTLTATQANRPSFVGPITATSLDLGSEPPETEIIHIGDIDTLFLNHQEQAQQPASVPEDVHPHPDDPDFFPSSASVIVNPNLAPGGGLGRTAGAAGPASPGGAPLPTPTPTLHPSTAELPPGNTATVAPSLQVHLKTNWKSTTVRLNIKTSLVIHYPSPHFMSLDLSINLVGLLFDGVIVLAFEGEKKKMHLSIVEFEEEEEEDDDEDEDEQELGEDEGGGFGPTEEDDGRSSVTHETGTTTVPTALRVQGVPPKLSRSITALDPQIGLPPTLGGRRPPLRSHSANAYLPSTNTFYPPPPSLASTPGLRLLPALHFESSVGDEGQGNKHHMLKNVGKVERFVQEMVRKMIEDHLLYPHFKSFNLKRNPS
ncbi:Mitochondrial distribution and morphology protein 12 [Tilletia horrida]|uniref:Mitochondrial distribution and morphology protein 12 n=1 Tax=Tilletia horrida TaxID=155126 RepID=A0AAN6GKM2_9BASI|nr:Mitochondrial distribution and morphology protein 12 [Tilletia horrida]KAK0561959.1 Mitochondrial distribution and morphology protein 12 [Tilletia horrida]